MHRTLAALLLVAVTTAYPALLSGAGDPAGERLGRLVEEFIPSHMAQRPLDAVALGWHQYDGGFPSLERSALVAEQARLARYEAEFAAIEDRRLSPAQHRDLQAILAAIRTERWKFEQQKAPWRNPMFYAGAVDVSIYLKRDWAPLADRVRSLSAVLRHAPAVMRAAKANLEPQLARPFVETAIEVAEGTASFLEKDVAAFASRVTDPAVLSEFKSANGAVIAVHRQFASWLRAERLPQAHGRFATGAGAFRAMLRAERIDLSPDQVLSVGLKEMKAEQARMREAARVIDPALTPAQVYERISQEHATAADLIPRARQTLEKARQFVVDHALLTPATEVRAQVEETLPPFRSTSTASMDTPGPFETRATTAYYYVTPVEPDWTPKQAEEWLRSLNDYTLEVVNIHEAYPGHYFQGARVNVTPLGVPAKVFSSYPFVEGWAHYCEQMALDEGYGGTNALVAAINARAGSPLPRESKTAKILKFGKR